MTALFTSTPMVGIARACNPRSGLAVNKALDVMRYRRKLYHLSSHDIQSNGCDENLNTRSGTWHLQSNGPVMPFDTPCHPDGAYGLIVGPAPWACNAGYRNTDIRTTPF